MATKTVEATGGVKILGNNSGENNKKAIITIAFKKSNQLKVTV